MPRVRPQIGRQTALIYSHLLDRSGAGARSPQPARSLAPSSTRLSTLWVLLPSLCLLKINHERTSRSLAPPGRICPSYATVAYPRQKVTIG